MNLTLRLYNISQKRKMLQELMLFTLAIQDMRPEGHLAVSFLQTIERRKI